MQKVILSGIGIILIAPIILTVLFYFLHKSFYRDGKKAFHFAISYSSPVYLLSVLLLNNYLFEKTYFLHIFIFLVLLFLSFSYIQWRVTKKIVLKVIVKLFSRICFLIFFSVYFLLMILGIFRNILSG